MPWEGIWEVVILPVTGYAVFDWFFTAMVAFGLLATAVGWILNLISRS